MVESQLELTLFFVHLGLSLFIKLTLHRCLDRSLPRTSGNLVCLAKFEIQKNEHNCKNKDGCGVDVCVNRLTF
jgi:hypothetical protein